MPFKHPELKNCTNEQLGFITAWLKQLESNHPKSLNIIYGVTAAINMFTGINHTRIIKQLCKINTKISHFRPGKQDTTSMQAYPSRSIKDYLDSRVDRVVQRSQQMGNPKSFTSAQLSFINSWLSNLSSRKQNVVYVVAAGLHMLTGISHSRIMKELCSTTTVLARSSKEPSTAPCYPRRGLREYLRDTHSNHGNTATPVDKQEGIALLSNSTTVSTGTPGDGQEETLSPRCGN